MTTQKAVKIIDYTIQMKIEQKEGYIDPKKSWNYGEVNFSGITLHLARIIDDDVKILKFICAQIMPKCKHPKKMRDRDGNGDWYCMNCNQNL